jgi:hypothetical protein
MKTYWILSPCRSVERLTIQMKIPLILVVLAGCGFGQEAPLQEPAEAVGKRLAGHYRAGEWVEAQTLKLRILQGDKGRAVTAISRVLEEPGLQGKAGLIDESGRSGLSGLAPTLVRLLEDADADVRRCSATALGNFGGGAAVDALERRVRIESNIHAAYEMRVALGRLGRPYLKYFMTGLGDRNPQRRYCCMVALGTLADKRAVPALMSVLASKDTWEPWHASQAITLITGIQNTLTTRTITRPDGSTQTEGMRRPLEDFRADCAGWVGRHKTDVEHSVEEAPEAWSFTPEPSVPGLDVSFSMTGAQVKALYDRSKVPYSYSPAKESVENGNRVLFLESLTAERPPESRLPEGLIDVCYTFDGGRLDSISIRSVRHPDSSLGVLREKWGLVEKGVGQWEGLKGQIVVSHGKANGEWTQFVISLNLAE